MRVVRFEPSSRRYEIAYQALLFSPLPVHANERKAHGEILSKLEAIGQLKQMYDGQGAPRGYGPDEVRLYVCVSGGMVLLTEAEWDLLKRHIVAMVEAPTFSKSLLREGDALVEYVTTIPPEPPALVVSEPLAEPSPIEGR